VKGILFVGLALALLLGGCAAPAEEGLEVREAWARPAVQGGNGAVYFVIRSSQEDKITGISSDIAEAVEMHESTMSGDVMEMRQLESVPLAAGEQVSFEPGGLHVMLIGLKQDLRAGDEIDITLHFQKHEDIPVTVQIQDTPASEQGH
jgi:copper(I)-binding protein